MRTLPFAFAFGLCLASFADPVATTAISARAYVQDGLVAQWDGIENAGYGLHDAAPSSWTELVNGAAVTHNGTLTYTPTNVYFNGSAYFSANIPAVKTALNAKAMTTELFLCPVSYQQYAGYLHIGDSGSNRELVLDMREESGSASAKGAFSGLQYAQSGWYDTTHCCIPVDTKSYFGKNTLATIRVDSDGAKIAFDAGSNVHTNCGKGVSASSDLVGIGWYYGSNKAKFMLYSSRFYSRTLADDEVAWNNMIDRHRFLGAALDASVSTESRRVVDGEVRGLSVLNVSPAGAGSSTLTANGVQYAIGASAWIPCDATNTLTYRAVPPSGSVFLGWTGDTQGISGAQLEQPTLVLASSVPRRLTAVFNTPSVKTWVGSASALASNPANWQDEDGTTATVAPRSGDAVIVDADGDGVARPMTWDIGDVAIASWTQPETYTNTVTFNLGLDTFTVTGDVSLVGGSWTHAANPSLASSSDAWKNGRGTKQLIVSCGGNFSVGANAAVHGDARGFLKGQGPGYGVSGYQQGSAHGSSGDNNANKTYGSLFEPVTIGSGARNNSGGGAVRLTVAKKLTIDGRVSANAHAYTDWGCASGGSVYITAGSLAGTGKIEANAEAYTGGRTGGGGRIAVYLTDADADFSAYTGTLIAYGSRYYNSSTGAYRSYGDSPSGTIYLEKKSDDAGRGELRLTNGTRNPGRWFYTPLPTSEGPYHFSKVTLGAGTQLGIAAANSVTVDEVSGYSAYYSHVLLLGGTLIFPRDFAFSKFTLGVYSGSTSTIDFADGSGTKTLTLNSGAVLTCDMPLTVNGSVVVASGGTVKHTRNYDLQVKGSSMVKLNLTVNGDLTVASGGAITAYAAGYDYAYTPGQGACDFTKTYGSGSHAGLAMESPNVVAPDTKVYGSIREPTDFGSTGYWSSNANGNFSGGGVIKLVVSGTATVNGTVDADGKGICANVPGSGAGGSLWLICGDLLGSGRLSADGGSHCYNASVMGGSGGRVAVTLTEPTADFTTFTGIIAATGGHSTNTQNTKNYTKVAGPAGTVYLRTGAQGAEEGTLIITNGLISTSAVTQETVIGPNVTDTRIGSVKVGKNGRLRIAAASTLSVMGDCDNTAGGSFTSTDAPDSSTAGSTLAFFGASTVGRLLGCYSLANLSVTEPGKELQIDCSNAGGAAIRSGGALTLTGEDGNLVKLRSTVTGTQAELTVLSGASASVSFADIQDSDASAGLAIAATDSKDSGNNSDNWSFSKIVPGEENWWTGEAGNSDWGDIANWSCNRAPEVTDFIRIGYSDPAPEYWPTLPADTVFNKLDISSSARLNFTASSITVTNRCTIYGTLGIASAAKLVCAGDVTLGTISGGTADLVLTGNVAQALTLANNAFGTVTVAKDGGTASFTDGVTCSQFVSSRTDPVTVAVAAGETLATDTLRLACADGATPTLTLKSATSGSPWNLNVRNLALVAGVIACDSHATGKDIYADTPSTDGGGNDRWHFGSRSVTWVGGSSGAFANAANWSDGEELDANTRVILDKTVTMTIPQGTTPRVREFIASSGTATLSGKGTLDVVSLFVVEGGATVVADLPVHVEDYAEVMNGGTVTCTKCPSAAVTNRLFLTVDGNMTVASGGKVTVGAKGLNITSHPSFSDWASSHGGIGSVATCYGSVFEPAEPGIGARNGGKYGGGVMRLVVGGMLTVDGKIDANGQYLGNFSPPGGSVWITCGTLSGAGEVAANGGDYNDNSYNATGAGGRVAVYETKAQDFAAFTGVVSAYAGRYLVDGVYLGTPLNGAGTVYLETAADRSRGGRLVLANVNGSTNGAQLPPAYCGDEASAFKYVRLELKNAGSIVLSRDLRVRDIDVTAGTCVINLNDHTLTVSKCDHRNRRGWKGTASVSKGTNGQGKIVWLPRPLSLIVR